MQGDEMQESETKTDTTEETIISFMLAFWPLALVLGIVDHFLLPEYDLRLFCLAAAGAAGVGNVWLKRRKAERLKLLGEHENRGLSPELEGWLGPRRG
jgi:hypothetical protein